MEGEIARVKAKVVAEKQAHQAKNQNSYANQVQEIVKTILARVEEASRQGDGAIDIPRENYMWDYAIDKLKEHFKIVTVHGEDYMTNNWVIKYWTVSW